MSRTQDLGNISTRLRRIARLASEHPERSFVNLAHYIDVYFLYEAAHRVRKDGAAGVDGVTWEEYLADLNGNLRQLHERFKSGLYRAPPVRRKHIPKGDGTKTRPIGMPTLEDKILQQAVRMVIEPLWEAVFLPFSYGYRPDRSAHDALHELREGMMSMKGGWVLDVDIQSFFDDLDHTHLRDFLDLRVRDGVIRRALGKWLKAGVMEEGLIHYSETGTPQGGVISPLLANIYLHEVVDRWFEEEVRPRMGGACFMIRYADDMVLVFKQERDARRVQAVLAKRLSRFGLCLHPEKTRLVRFTRPKRDGTSSRESGPRSFDFLGFTHYWDRSRRGYWVVKKKTASSRISRTLKSINQWCARHRHKSVRWQYTALKAKLYGHYGYFGLRGNFAALSAIYWWVTRIWHKWLNRRSQRGGLCWGRFKRLSSAYALPRPRIRPSAWQTKF